MRYRIYAEALTVLAIEGLEILDLNSMGEPCANVEDLREFVCELHRQGAYTQATRDRLLAEVAEELGQRLKEKEK